MESPILKPGETMNQIAEWLQRIITVIILAGFLEMLLPQNELKNVTKMIMGLIIMAILIQPVIKILDLPQNIVSSLPTVNEEKNTLATDELIQNGLKLREDWNKKFKQQDKINTERKIKNLLVLIDEIRLRDINLNYEDSNLNKVSLIIQPVAQTNLNNKAKQKTVIKIINSVQLITNLPEERIEVLWND